MVYLEFEYLRRSRRTTESAATILANLQATLGVELCPLPFPLVANVAAELAWTNDPFDRMIVAQARANHSAPLISADARILEHYPQAVW